MNGKLSLDSQFEEAASFEEEEKRLDMSPPLSPPPSLRLSPLFDAHCHLQDRRLGEEKQGGESEEQRRHRRLDDIVARARSAGVAGVACCACSEDDWHEVAALADRYPGFVHPSFGLHPWYLEGRRPGWGARLEALLRSRPGAGVGESGLDRAKTSKRKLPPLDVQLEALGAHARLARELRRPLTVHCVRAAGALHDALSPFAPFLRRQASGSPSASSSPCSSSSGPGSCSPSAAAALDNTCVIFHGWQGPREEVLRLCKLGTGVFFSLGARSLPPKEQEEGEGEGGAPAGAGAGEGSLSHIPLSRLLVETDSPDGFEPRCLGEGVEVFEEGGGEEERKKDKEGEENGEEEEAVSVLGEETKQGLGLAESNTERNRKQANSKRTAKSALNQPANVSALLPELARALGKDESEVAMACWENSLSVFCGAPLRAAGPVSG